MKIIITENQKKEIMVRFADLIMTILQKKYPNFVDMYFESKDETEICNDEDCGTLIFYYDHKDRIFYFSVYFLDELYEMTGLNYFNLDKEDPDYFDNREHFNELVKVFAKRHFGFTAKDVYLHWY